MKKAIVLAGSRGIGKSIANSLRDLNFDVIATSSKDLDTSDISQVKAFIEKQKETDILVFNTGGPPSMEFSKITEELWIKYFNQLFLSFCLILQNLKIRKGGFVFLISSSNIKEPIPNLILSNSYRIASASVLKSLSKTLAADDVTCVNIAPGPVETDRLRGLVDDIPKFASTLPMKRVGNPDEIGNFVKALVEHQIKYMTGVTINFDGGVANYIL